MVNFNSYLPIELVNILNFIIELIYDDEISKYVDNESQKYLFKQLLKSTGIFSDEFLYLI